MPASIKGIDKLGKYTIQMDRLILEPLLDSRPDHCWF